MLSRYMKQALVSRGVRFRQCRYRVVQQTVWRTRYVTLSRFTQQQRIRYRIQVNIRQSKRRQRQMGSRHMNLAEVSRGGRLRRCRYQVV